jgi:hypothetical protein
MRRRPPSAEVRLGSGAGRLIRTTRAAASAPRPRPPPDPPPTGRCAKFICPLATPNWKPAQGESYFIEHTATVCTILLSRVHHFGAIKEKYARGFSGCRSWEWSQIAQAARRRTLNGDKKRMPLMLTNLLCTNIIVKFLSFSLILRVFGPQCEICLIK